MRNGVTDRLHEAVDQRGRQRARRRLDVRRDEAGFPAPRQTFAPGAWCSGGSAPRRVSNPCIAATDFVAFRVLLQQYFFADGLWRQRFRLDTTRWRQQAIQSFIHLRQLQNTHLRFALTLSWNVRRDNPIILPRLASGASASPATRRPIRHGTPVPASPPGRPITRRQRPRRGCDQVASRRRTRQRGGDTRNTVANLLPEQGPHQVVRHQMTDRYGQH